MQFTLKSSIKRKLIMIIIITSWMALIVACVAFIFYDRITFEKRMVRELNVLADIIGDNSTAAISFLAADDANKVLSALKVNQYIMAACIYTKRGEIFAKYIRQDLINSVSITPGLKDFNFKFHDDYLEINRKISLDLELIGHVYIMANLDEMKLRRRQFISLVSIFLLLLFFFVFIATLRLQRFITKPIQHLADIARKFSHRKDYTLRAQKFSDDEIGYLTERFNEMLSQMQKHEIELKKAHDEITKHAHELQKELQEKKKTETRLKVSLNEKEILLKEIHHRVKNNLQIISSLLNLQTGYTKDKSVKQIVQESQNRIQTMALIHEMLYQAWDLARIDFAEYIKNLTSHLFHSYNVSSEIIKLNIRVDDVSLNINTAIPCGLIINELISNSLKYAFPKVRNITEGGDVATSQEISISLQKETNGMLLLVISDNGVGLPDDIDFINMKTLGLQLVKSLTEQIGGDMELIRHGGTTFKIAFRP